MVCLEVGTKYCKVQLIVVEVCRPDRKSVVESRTRLGDKVYSKSSLLNWVICLEDFAFVVNCGAVISLLWSRRSANDH
jgi:hypothetical protein